MSAFGASGRATTAVMGLDVVALGALAIVMIDVVRVGLNGMKWINLGHLGPFPKLSESVERAGRANVSSTSGV